MTDTTATQPDDNAPEQAAAEAAAADDVVGEPTPEEAQAAAEAAQEEQDKLTGEVFGPPAYEKIVEVTEAGEETLSEIYPSDSPEEAAEPGNYPDNPVPGSAVEESEPDDDDRPTDANTKAEIVAWLLDSGSDESESALNAKTKAELLAEVEAS